MTSFKRWLPLLLIFTLVGCVKANQAGRVGQDESLKKFSTEGDLSDYNNQSLFQTDDVQLVAKKFNLKGNQDWKEVNNIQLWFKLCGLRDRASQGSLQGEKFHVSSELGDDIIASTGPDDQTDRRNPVTVNNNCLYWMQEVEYFDYLAPSVNLVLHYEIKSLSGELGKVVRRVAFNPWDMYRNNSQFNGVMDITFFDRSQWPQGRAWAVESEDVIKALHGNYVEGNAQLQMRNVKVLPVPKERERQSAYNASLERLSEEERKIRKEIDAAMITKRGYNMTINIEAQPFVWLEDSTGNLTEKNITTGKFKVFMNLVASDVTDDTKKYLLSADVYETTGRSTAFTWSVGENGLQASVPLRLLQDPEKGRVELVLKVVPESRELRNIKPFTAVYDLGQYNQWVRSQSPQFKRQGYEPMKGIDFDQYMTGLEREFGGITGLREAERYYFGPMTMRFVRIMPGESATDRTLQYRVETCVTDGFNGGSVGAGLQFKIKTNDVYRGDYEIIRQTNNNGCLTWFGFLSHKYYRKEVLEKKVADVTYMGTVRGKDISNEVINPFHKAFTYYMNPWDEKWTFGWDERDMLEDYPEEIKEQRKTAPETKLFIADFKYETMGFRYSIDRFLNLKVKKAILLKAYPYVLKYNSIVLGRGATEKLRDGVYLMKVALQKDYLDPAAKGVRIYDKGLRPEANDDTQIDMATACKIARDGDQSNANYAAAYQLCGEPLFTIEEETDEEGMTRDALSQMKMYEALEASGADFPDVNGKASQARMRVVYDEDTGDTRTVRLFKDPDTGRDIELSANEPLPDPVLRQSRKQYISIQQKLVRVLGGMIITPVEFDVDDLRLMRIRNQFFIQLQTIDEHKLRAATTADNTLIDLIDEFDFQEKIQEVYSFLGETDEISNQENLQEKLDEVFQMQTLADGKEAWTQDGTPLGEARRKVFNMFGLDQFEEGTPQYQAHLEAIRGKILRILQYKANGLTPQAALIEEKRGLINEIIMQLREKSLSELEDFEDQVDTEYDDAYSSDPWMKYMFSAFKSDKETLLARIIQERVRKAEEACEGRSTEKSSDDQMSPMEQCEREQKLDVIRSLSIADFTESPLAPNFSFDLLTNDGVHEPKYNAQGDPIDDDGKSGLPSRTFVGPLTFVFNTNGSSLRPTDILNEAFCTTAQCSVQETIEENKVPVESVQKAIDVGSNGQVLDDLSREIYMSGDSVNALYENNKYYGFLRAYHKMTVDDLIEEKKKINEDNERKMEVGSQISNFTRGNRFKYTLLNDNPKSRLKHIRWLDCARDIPMNRLKDGECYDDVLDGPEILNAADFYSQVNERAHYREDTKPGFYDKDLAPHIFNKTYYNIGDQVWDADLMEKLISYRPGDEEYDTKLVRDFSHRMCFVLTQNLLSNQFYDREFLTEKYRKRVERGREVPEDKRNSLTTERNLKVASNIEIMCHRFLSNVYNYPNLENYSNTATIRKHLERNGLDKPNYSLVKYSPIVLERKARVYKTTGKYVYRGGKSLNINLSTNFNISSSNGIKTSTSMSFKPYHYFKEAGKEAAGGVGAGIGFMIGGIPGAAIGYGVGTIFKVIAGGFDITRQTGKDESAGKTQGTNVSSGTFLVNQQATFDIELGEYERCMVARFHPSFLKIIMRAKNEVLKPDFVDHPVTSKYPYGDPHVSDIESLGILFCTGKPVKDEPLPVKEKYYYFTQHFTEGDMLDTADLHNHPWLLQMRGIRDFMAFTAMIGAREVDYIDENKWFTQVLSQTASDVQSLNLSGSQVENLRPEFRIASRDEDINWPLEELSRTYFNVSPTFPGMYTFFHETPEWPYYETDAGLSFQNPEEDEE